MGYIGEQIRELREIAEMYDGIDGGEILKESADTIESLYKKLKERSNNGWIPCSERLPENEEMVLLSLQNLDICVGFNADFEKRFHIVGYGYTNYESVLAWQPLPEPYTEN